MSEIYHGEVVRYEPAKGYGFILPDGGGPDVFLHVSQLVHGMEPDRLKPHVRVMYQVAQDTRGSKAMHIRFEDLDGDEDLADVLTSDEFNQAVERIASKFRDELTDLARRHGWVA